jgi:hypothetical protein
MEFQKEHFRTASEVVDTRTSVELFRQLFQGSHNVPMFSELKRGRTLFKDEAEAGNRFTKTSIV